jgi:hypothetical protein
MSKDKKQKQANKWLALIPKTKRERKAYKLWRKKNAAMISRLVK